MSVYEGVVNADVSKATTQEQGVNFQAAQQYLEIGTEESGVASFPDQVILLLKSHFLFCDFCTGVILETMDILAAVQFPTKIYKVGAMHFLNKDNRNLETTGFIDKLNAAGYRNVYEDYPWSEPIAVTQIVAQNGDTQMAEDVRRILGFGEVRVESTGVLESDVTIRLGRDWLQQQNAAQPEPGAI